ncbi:hypothetical protein [Nocardioides sp. Leaf307]|uniref:hypothetical protein n=1 Tax=Nocardioides sp. Leaf307 TaxID=1736331 RepID=UPI000702DA1D|nr:hypothetical protein [Nocardioides sp. Leaf307]KQQ43195.1 hypothetical protein ASF50_04230 [Nocardioides sp. Leaf307]
MTECESEPAATDVARPAARDPRDPGRRDPRGPALVATAALLLLVAVVASAVLALSHADGYRWSQAALVPADGRPHVVELADDGPALVWTYEAEVVPACTVRDTGVRTDVGTALEPGPVDGAYRREGGSTGDWVATSRIRPASSSVEVTCERAASPVAVESAPALPPLLAGLGAWVALPLGLGLAGLALAGGAALLGVRRGRGGAR